MEYLKLNLLENFEFSKSCVDIAMFPGLNQVIAVGSYPPSMKVYDLANFSSKFERNFKYEPVCVIPLAEDKIIILRRDKTIEFHNKFGRFEEIKLKKQPYYAKINPYTGELLMGGNYNFIYRFDLNQGRFFDEIPIKGVSYDLSINEKGLITSVGDNLSFIDPVSNKVFNIIEKEFSCISSNIYNIYCSNTNKVFNYDLRNYNFTENIYDSEITKIKYKNKKLMVSTNSSFYLNENRINLNYKINSFDNCEGILFVGGEQLKMDSFYIKELGEMPSFLK